MEHLSLQVIVNNPAQNDDGIVLENFHNSEPLMKISVNYLPRAIGDRNITIDSEGKLTHKWRLSKSITIHFYISEL